MPAAMNNLVGLRATSGLISRAGIVPMSSTQDMAGPMARSTADLAALLDVLVGYDPADPVTAEGDGHVPPTYTTFLDPDAFEGRRIGRLTTLFAVEPYDAEVLDVVNAAAEQMQLLGAEIVDIQIPELPEPSRIGRLNLTVDEMEAALNAYLAARPSAPVRTFREIVASGKCVPSTASAMSRSLAFDHEDTDGELKKVAERAELRRTVLAAMAANRLDAILYPVSRIKAPTITTVGAYNVALAPITGLPAITVPAGFLENGLPVGLELLGRAWSEPRLIALAHALERQTRNRRPPDTTPPLE
jgi:Asp-tRNA(Asn)/Glu-tRNA(Gln) amidotransferase A subunit family amidase